MRNKSIKLPVKKLRIKPLIVYEYSTSIIRKLECFKHKHIIESMVNYLYGNNTNEFPLINFDDSNIKEKDFNEFIWNIL